MQMHVAGSNGIVLSPEGLLNAGTGLKLESQLLSLMRNHSNPSLFLSFERVESIDSAGLMTLVATIQLSKRYGFELTFCAVPPQLQIVLEMSCIDQAVNTIQHAPMMLPVAA